MKALQSLTIHIPVLPGQRSGTDWGWGRDYSPSEIYSKPRPQCNGYNTRFTQSEGDHGALSNPQVPQEPLSVCPAVSSFPGNEGKP